MKKAIAVVLVVATAFAREEEECTPFARQTCTPDKTQCYSAGLCQCGVFETVECETNPCEGVECGDGYICKKNTCGRCAHQCIPEEVPVPVPPPAACAVQQCGVGGECPHSHACNHKGCCEFCECRIPPTCGKGYTLDQKCTSSDVLTGACKIESSCCAEIRCRKETVSGETCTPHSTQACTPDKTQCYNALTCTCGAYPMASIEKDCGTDPCNRHMCNKGYTCKANLCGGCGYQCVKESVPAPPVDCGREAACSIAVACPFTHACNRRGCCEFCECRDMPVCPERYVLDRSCTEENIISGECLVESRCCMEIRCRRA